MIKLLVVMDSSSEATLAIDHALKLARDMNNVELVFLYAEALKPTWQASRQPSMRNASAFLLNRAMARASAMGVASRTRHEVGDLAETVSKVASEERCDLIVMPDKGMSTVARAVLMLTGLCAATAPKQVMLAAPVPVTVVSHFIRRPPIDSREDSIQ